MAELTKWFEIESGSIFIAVELIADGAVSNDGIGHYEYWGMRGFDSGTRYWETYEVTYKRDEYSEQEQNIIDKYISSNEKEIGQSFSEEWESQEEYYDPHDYDDWD